MLRGIGLMGHMKQELEFDYSKATLDELDERAMQLLVFDTKELSSVLKGHLFIERILDSLIDSELKHPEYLRRNQKLTFDLKIDLARALGLLPEKLVSPVKALNNIRNKYAHKESYTVSLEELTGLKFKWTPEQNKAYRGACEKGVEEAALIATLFLTWTCMSLASSIKKQ